MKAKHRGLCNELLNTFPGDKSVETYSVAIGGSRKIITTALVMLLFVTVMVISVPAQVATNAVPAATPTPPPGSPAKRSAADLEKLVAPIALYPDPLIATVLPASAYPLEIVQAARFVKDTNNIAKLDAQPWDENVKAIARLPDVIKQMDENISWTSDLGDAFINQPKELMDSVQAMRGKAQQTGALQTTPQQVVTVTNTVVTNVVQDRTVYVTNQVVQIQPSQPEVIYVPQYNPTVVYGSYPAYYPGYYYPSSADVAAASVVSFGVGMAMGAVFANNCDWHGGGVYWGGHGDVDIDRNVNRNVNRNVSQNRTANVQGRTGQGQQKWQPDQSRLKNSGSTLSSAQTREARGWGGGQTASATGTASSRAQQARTSASQARSSATGATRPSASTTAGSRPTGSRAGTTASGTRPSTAQSGSRISSSAGASRPSTPRVTSSSGSYGGGAARSSSAFSGVSSGSMDRAASQRGSMSRSSGGGGYRGGGGGGRGGGGGGRRR